MGDIIPFPEAVPKTPETFEHKWIYSVVPAALEYDLPLRIFLVAYCRICDSTVSKSVDYDAYSTRINKAGIPRFGCVSAYAGL